MSTLPGDAPQRLIAAVKGRYIIQRLIGSGASSKVFLAEDEKHGRPVAIKVMHSDLAASVGAQRFSREIRVAARLSHPHILTVFDSGDAEGLLWYAMPFVDGESVRDRLNRDQQLPVNDIISITRDVADALAYAHEQGVIHRDVKPENILLSRMHALVADFGIAKAKDARLTTEAGMALGTPAYMSPEQASGEQIIDGRSDVYALGCLMYEMLTGKPAFSGKSVAVILSQVMTTTPASVAIARPDTPPQLQAAIEIAMAKDPAERFQTATQLADALRWALTPSSSPVILSPVEPMPAVVMNVGATPDVAARPVAPPLKPAPPEDSASVSSERPGAPKSIKEFSTGSSTSGSSSTSEQTSTGVDAMLSRLTEVKEPAPRPSNSGAFSRAAPPHKTSALAKVLIGLVIVLVGLLLVLLFRS